MRKVKEAGQDKTTQQTFADEIINAPYTGKVLFQHKIDRLTVLLKGTKLDPALKKPQA